MSELVLDAAGAEQEARPSPTLPTLGLTPSPPDEALALTEADLDPRRGSLLVQRGKGAPP